MYDRKELKRGAKRLLRESRPHYMLVALVYLLLTSGLSSAVTALTGMGSVLAGSLSIFLNILIALFSMVMGVGLAHYALRLSRGEQSGMGDLFEAFSFAGRSIGMNLLTALYTVLWMLLFCLICGVVAAAGLYLMDRIPALGIIIAIVAYIGAVVAALWVSLRYAMAPFALADDPDGGASGAVRRSVRLMKGNKGKLFVLMLSFLGWELLALLIGIVVLLAGLLIGGTVWLVENLLVSGGDWLEFYSAVSPLLEQMRIWPIVAEIVCLPLTMWLTVYVQTAYARFYNYVSGYGGCVSGEPPFEPVAAVEAPVHEQEHVWEPAKPKQPPEGGYYTSIIPPEQPSAEPETPDADDEEEL